jgi:hypothetical protein
MQGAKRGFLFTLCSQDVLLCRPLCRQHERWSDMNVGNQSLYVGLFTHGGTYGRLHDWQTAPSRSDRNHGRRWHPDGDDGDLYLYEDPVIYSPVSAIRAGDGEHDGPDKHLPGETVFQTSHAGLEMIKDTLTRQGAAWARLKSLQTDYLLTPAEPCHQP